MTQSRTHMLQAAFNNGVAPRPILTSLNGDNSWIISFPRPAAERASALGKAYFHVVIDAWLAGAATTALPWLISVHLSASPAITDGGAVESVIREIEEAAAPSRVPSETGLRHETDNASVIDALFINFHYADHLHEKTLRTFHPDIHVFSTPEAAAIIRPWAYFHLVTETRDLDPANPNWQALHPAGLPEWLNVFRLVGHHELNFATAIVYSSFSTSSSSPSQQQQPQQQQQQHEVLLYSPHGIRADQPVLQRFLSDGNPPVRVLAILHALKDSFAFGMRQTLGVAGGLAVGRLARPKYWVKTHDSPLLYRGVVAWLAWINDVARTLQSGLDHEARGKDDGNEWVPNLMEIMNGESVVLE